MSKTPEPMIGFEQMLERFGRQIEETMQRWEHMPGLEMWGGDVGAIQVDLTRNDEAYILTADVPGFDRDEVSINIDNRTLHITADIDEMETEEGLDSLRRERVHRSMSRMIHLPEQVDADGATATLRNGVLTVTLPRSESPSGIEIEIE